MENVIIDTEERLQDDIEEFKLKSTLDDEENYTVAKLKLCRDSETEEPLLFYEQELERNFKEHSDPFGRRHVIKVFTPENFTAAADTALERKFNDTILAHKHRVESYSPLTDIYSDNMKLFMSEKEACFLDDIGVSVDGFGEDFQGMESVSATPFMQEIAYDAVKVKEELSRLKSRYSLIKQEMADLFEVYVDPSQISDDRFAAKLSVEKVPEGLTQSYLALKEQIRDLEGQLGEVNMTVFNETKSKIKLPKLIDERSLDDLLQI